MVVVMEVVGDLHLRKKPPDVVTVATGFVDVRN